MQRPVRRLFRDFESLLRNRERLRARFRPGLELLEDRRLLATATNVVTGGVLDLTPDTAKQGAANVPIFSFQLEKSGGSTSFQSVTVHYTGTSSSDVATVKLYKESGTVPGTFDPASDTLVASTTSITANQATLTPASSHTITGGAGIQFYLAVDLASGAVNGHTIDFEVTAGTWNPTGSTTVDAVTPTVTGVSSTTANGSYKAGTVIPVTVSFSEPVVVAGTPQLALNSGGTASYSSGSGTSTLTFSYTVGATQNSTDLDYTSTSALALNGGTIRDAAGNNATLTLPAPGAAGSLGANKNIVIDTLAPAAPGVSLAHDTGSSATDKVTSDGSLSLSGVEGSAAVEYSADGGATWSASFSAAEGANDVLVRQTDVAGNVSGNGSLSFTLDTVAPAVSSIVVSDPVINEADAGGTFTVTVTYNQAMDTGTAPAISFSPGVASTLAFTGGFWNGAGTVYTANYSVADANVTVDPVGVNAKSGRDLAGNVQPAAVSPSAFRVDTVSPTVVAVVRNNGTVTRSAVVRWTFTFSENVKGLDVGDFALGARAPSAPGCCASPAAAGSGTSGPAPGRATARWV